ncbi:MAG: DNA repair protein RecO (recombination protein O) [Candidatus Azotimanducaceae bacterium]|jgi:DNA repair protein RecO (recombination protein O)
MPAYILHARKYRDTSLILEMFTQHEGRVAAVQRGGRGKSGAVQPFTPLLVSYLGKGELKSISKLDAGAMHYLTGDRLLLGMYANELLMRLLGKFEKVPGLFSAYQSLLLTLVADDQYQIQLRRFELRLLDELGYGISFGIEASTGDFIDPGKFYRFVPDEGFRALSAETDSSYAGHHLLAIADDELDSEAVEAAARKIARQAIARLLGDKPLNSRELFQKLNVGRRE